jgi:hypothetical protein
MKNRGAKPRKRNSKAYRSEATAEYKRAIDRMFGSQGAASPVRKIDPATGRVVEIIGQSDK